MGYLRAFVIVLVVTHHTALVYATFAPPVAPSFIASPRWWQAFPVVDAQKWSGTSTIVGFNDTFFMSLMFVISGLFVWKSLQRKRINGFLRDRTLRLGIPFLGAAAARTEDCQGSDGAETGGASVLDVASGLPSAKARFVPGRARTSRWGAVHDRCHDWASRSA
jgi:hypothetical protein